MAGQTVILGSRDAARASAAATELRHADGGAVRVDGADNFECARRADVVVVAVPWEGHGALLADIADALSDKVVIDCVNPLGFDKQGAYPLPVPEGSAAQQAAALLQGSRVVGAFHHVSAVLLLDPLVDVLDLDVLVVGDDRGATDIAQALAARITGFRGVYAGRLRNAHQVEALTANLISMNRRYKIHAGVRITDI
jgi:hypothetical protein